MCVLCLLSLYLHGEGAWLTMSSSSLAASFYLLQVHPFSGGSPTCLVGAGSAYLYSGITPFAMVSGLPFAPLPSVSLGTTPLLPPTLLSSISQLPVLPAQGLPSQSGLSLSLLSEPVSARLVKRIRGSHFVEM